MDLRRHKRLLSVLVVVFCLASGESQRIKGKTRQLFVCTNEAVIPFVNFCDGKLDCTDGSDEILDHSSISIELQPAGEYQRCSNRQNNHTGSCVVERQKICSAEVVCLDRTPCDFECGEFYRCQGSDNTRQCVRRDSVCDGNPCNGCREDHEWKNGIGFKCPRSGKDCVLPQQLLHDDISDCDGGVDICFEPDHSTNKTRILNREKCFLCLDNVTLVRATAVCDWVIDCPDLSDECLCEGRVPTICNQVISRLEKETPLSRASRDTGISGSRRKEKTPRRSVPRPRDHHRPSIRRLIVGSDIPAYVNCSIGHVRCSDGRCIRRENICDGIRHCENDESFSFCRGTIKCKDATRYEQKCRCDGGIASCRIAYGTACNGEADCPVPLPRGSAYLRSDNTFPEDECEATCPNESFFRCIRSPVQIFLPPIGHKRCHGDINSTTFKVIGQKLVCNGRVDCPLGDDERNCSRRFVCAGKQLGIVSIELNQTCDGTENCEDGSDELDALCGDKRFRCANLGNKVNIDKELYCDGQITCDDESDESNCTDDRFYCENKKPLFIAGRKKFNGRGDCSDWSDECPTKNMTGAPQTFSSKYELIANPVLRVFVWIFGLVSLVGNATVIYRETIILKKSDRTSPTATANRMLVLHLAASDILMGIYLIILGSAGVKMSGQYCSKDLEWRSSAVCTTLGILAVISSETAVTILALLAGCRMFAVLQPFRSRHQPSKSIIVLMLLCAWGIGFLFAFLPLASSLANNFIPRAEFQYNPYSRKVDMSIHDARVFFRQLLTYDLKENISLPDSFSTIIQKSSWMDLQRLSSVYLRKHFFQGQRYFGYYSAESVCIPKFFVTKSNPAWRFSFFMNLFNFISFMFVACSYVVIQIKAKQRAAVRGQAATKDKSARALQRRVMRLIFTDFCCWVPICIMAFCKLGGVNFDNVAYAFAAIILLPINSALNPLLYSDIPDLIWKKCFAVFNCRKAREERQIGSTNVDSPKESNDKYTHVTPL